MLGRHPTDITTCSCSCMHCKKRQCRKLHLARGEPHMAHKEPHVARREPGGASGTDEPHVARSEPCVALCEPCVARREPGVTSGTDVFYSALILS